MNKRELKEALNRAHSIILKLNRRVNNYEKIRRRFISIFYEVNPSSSRYIPVRVRTMVSIRDKYSCVKCGSQQDLQFDHTVAVANGGSNEVDNVQLLCRDCNLEKGVS